MTTKGEWKVYSGSDEQIADIGRSIKSNGFMTKNKDGLQSNVICSDTSHYLVVNPHPLADMICQWARTGQPVWFKDKKNGRTGKCLDNGSNIPHPFYAPEHYEYRFTPFKE